MSKSRDEIASELSKLREREAELEREMAQIEIAELREDYEQLIGLLQKFHKHGKLPDAVAAALSRSDGTFAPHQKIKKPQI